MSTLENSNSMVSKLLLRITQNMGAFKTYARRIVLLVMSISAIPGADWLWAHYSMTLKEREALEVSQLTTFDSFAGIVNQSYEMEGKAAKFVKEQPPFTKDTALQLIRREGSGSAAYFFSTELRDFIEVHHFYEELGLQVSKGVVSFDLIFELVTFPSNFSRNTSELCAALGNNWFGLRSGENDHSQEVYGMCENMQSLNERYIKEREVRRVCRDSIWPDWPCRKIYSLFPVTAGIPTLREKQ